MSRFNQYSLLIFDNSSSRNSKRHYMQLYLHIIEDILSETLNVSSIKTFVETALMRMVTLIHSEL